MDRINFGADVDCGDFETGIVGRIAQALFQQGRGNEKLLCRRIVLTQEILNCKQHQFITGLILLLYLDQKA
jgi:hypothetical protein